MKRTGRYNILLMKDEIGKAKPNTRKLPGEHFVFGKPEVRDVEDAGQSKYFVG